MERSLKQLQIIYEHVMNQIEEGIVISDDENKVIFVNKAAEAIEGIDSKTCLGKRMEDIYIHTKNTHSKHAAVLNTGIPANEYLNQYMIRESHKMMNVVERMFPVNIDKKTVAVYSLIKNLPVLKKNIDQSLELYTYFHKEKMTNGTKYTFNSIIGNDINFIEAISNARNVAKNQTTVLIFGETGTGKELFAQSIHNASPYQNGPFISVNCAAIPSTLLESMFFGTAKGAFTGAENMAGLFEQAEKGTLFLDEINSMDIRLQAKLLKVLEDKKVTRIGSEKAIHISCRILCALNEDPQKCIKEQRLRQDLYYRLSSCILHIPPLRQRVSDIPLLCKYYLQRFNKEYRLNIEDVDHSLMEEFKKYSWPGNVRELQHVIESAYSILEQNIKILQLKNIAYYYRKFFTEASKPQKEEYFAEEAAGRTDVGLKENMDNYEKMVLLQALNRNKKNITATAKELEITRQALQYKMKKYNLRL